MVMSFALSAAFIVLSVVGLEESQGSGCGELTHFPFRRFARGSYPMQAVVPVKK